jgi:hypothetical protein
MLKRIVLILFAGALVIQQSARGDYVLGINFEVSHPTTISAIGAYDGGSGFTSDETVGIFNDLTGNLVGPDLLFGPGISGSQMGNGFYEKVTPFVLDAGEYSMMALSIGGSKPGEGNSLPGGNSYEDLLTSWNLPGGWRFNSGIGFAIIGTDGLGGNNPFGALDPPPVPDGGTTAMFLTVVLAGMGWLQRKV